MAVVLPEVKAALKIQHKTVPYRNSIWTLCFKAIHVLVLAIHVHVQYTAVSNVQLQQMTSSYTSLFTFELFIFYNVNSNDRDFISRLKSCNSSDFFPLDCGFKFKFKAISIKKNKWFKWKHDDFTVKLRICMTQILIHYTYMINQMCILLLVGLIEKCEPCFW